MKNSGKKIKNGINSPNITDIATKSNMSAKEVASFLCSVKHSMEPLSKRLSVIENGIKRYYTVERKGIGVLKTEYGKFWQYTFTINDRWKKYSVIVRAEFNKDRMVPVFKNKDRLVLRIDSGCETGQMFGDLTCECRDQLHLTLKMLEHIGEGMIVYIPGQDGRGKGLTFKLAMLWAQDVLNINTVESASLLASNGMIDVRTYSGVVCILKFFGVSKKCYINLVTNNPKKAEVFAQNGYLVKYIPIIIRPNKYTEKHLQAKQDYLGHIGLIKKKRKK